MSDGVLVRIAAASLRLGFHGCEPGYIRSVCHARCCDTARGPCLVTIHPTERDAITARGGHVQGMMLAPRPGERLCPFKTHDHLCSLHATPDKPFGCRASPFTLNRGRTLVVRYRYVRLPCHRDGPLHPAYRAFASSFVDVLGPDEAARITAHLDAGGGNTLAVMPEGCYRRLVENDAAKRDYVRL